MWETRVPSLGWEDPLEKEMATHPSTLAWKIPCMEKHGRLQSMGSQRVGHDWAPSLHFITVVQPFVSICLMYKSWKPSPLTKSLKFPGLANLKATVLWYARVLKAMAPHPSTLAWKILWTEEPGRLQSMRSPRVRHDWATSLWLFTFMHWRRKWQPTPVFVPGEFQGWGSLVDCRLWGWTRLKRLSSSSRVLNLE